jgi:hypothetical protein
LNNRFGPEHCNVSFKWFCSYSPRGSDKEVYELCNIDWEFANVLFNIAILTYLKGKKESRNKNREEAKKCFQEAAGIILFLKDNQLKKINRRTNDLNDHALELIFNSFVGYVQLEVAKKACEGKSNDKLVASLYEGAKRLFNTYNIMPSAKPLAVYFDSQYKYCEAMSNYHMALHEEDDPQFLRDSEARLTFARDSLKTLYQNYPELEDEVEKVELAYKRVSTARAGTGEPPELDRKNLSPIEPKKIANHADYKKKCFSENPDSIFDENSSRERPEPRKESTSICSFIFCCTKKPKVNSTVANAL